MNKVKKVIRIREFTFTNDEVKKALIEYIDNNSNEFVSNIEYASVAFDNDSTTLTITDEEEEA